MIGLHGPQQYVKVTKNNHLRMLSVDRFAAIVGKINATGSQALDQSYKGLSALFACGKRGAHEVRKFRLVRHRGLCNARTRSDGLKNHFVHRAKMPVGKFGLEEFLGFGAQFNHHTDPE